MTGPEVRQLREGLGLEIFAFATTLGVHVSTLYRWEQTPGALRIDPLQAEILAKLQRKLHGQRAEKNRAIGDAIVKGLLLGGALVGLAALLTHLLDDETAQRRKGRR